jgi:uncharacterized membrane protein YgcG
MFFTMESDNWESVFRMSSYLVLIFKIGFYILVAGIIGNTVWYAVTGAMFGLELPLSQTAVYWIQVMILGYAISHIGISIAVGRGILDNVVVSVVNQDFKLDTTVQFAIYYTGLVLLLLLGYVVLTVIFDIASTHISTQDNGYFLFNIVKLCSYYPLLTILRFNIES